MLSSEQTSPESSSEEIKNLIEEFKNDFWITHIVDLQEHNPHWKEIFNQEQQRIGKTLNLWADIKLHHIGSILLRDFVQSLLSICS